MKNARMIIFIVLMFWGFVACWGTGEEPRIETDFTTTVPLDISTDVSDPEEIDETEVPEENASDSEGEDESEVIGEDTFEGNSGSEEAVLIADTPIPAPDTKDCTLVYTIHGRPSLDIDNSDIALSHLRLFNSETEEEIPLEIEEGVQAVRPGIALEPGKYILAQSGGSVLKSLEFCFIILDIQATRDYEATREALHEEALDLLVDCSALARAVEQLQEVQDRGALQGENLSVYAETTAVNNLSEEAKALAWAGQIAGAIDALNKIAVCPSQESAPPELLYVLCRVGSLQGPQAVEDFWVLSDEKIVYMNLVVDVCSQLILSSSENARYFESRGLAYALRGTEGDYEQAIADFEIFVAWLEGQDEPDISLIDIRKAWINDLQNERNPIDALRLDQLREDFATETQ